MVMSRFTDFTVRVMYPATFASRNLYKIKSNQSADTVAVVVRLHHPRADYRRSRHACPLHRDPSDLIDQGQTSEVFAL
jgi:hypothetical protein